MIESQWMIVYLSAYASNSYVLIYTYEIISKIVDFTNQIVSNKYMQKLIIFLWILCS